MRKFSRRLDSAIEGVSMFPELFWIWIASTENWKEAVVFSSLIMEIWFLVITKLLFWVIDSVFYRVTKLLNAVKVSDDNYWLVGYQFLEDFRFKKSKKYFKNFLNLDKG